MSSRKMVIIGAGPAGLTAAYEAQRKGFQPIVLDQLPRVGGLARTEIHGGNRIDIGGHRFFSKSDRIMAWWLSILPIQGAPAWDDRLLERTIPYLNPDGPDPELSDRVMLLRSRHSHILFDRKWYPYPLTLNPEILLKLGPIRTFKIGTSYVATRLNRSPRLESLEDLFIHRFGKELYKIFFQSYTEKVWGVSCKEIPAEWGMQRIRNLSVAKTIANALKKRLSLHTGIAQTQTETSLIDKFLYPKMGPGQLWEEVARIVDERGGQVLLNHKVNRVELEGGLVRTVVAADGSGHDRRIAGDVFISTMALKDLIPALNVDAGPKVRETAMGLCYRDFIVVGVLLKSLKVKNPTSLKSIGDTPPDQWLYIQEKDVRMSRVQLFHNWSPYLVSDRKTFWLGVEYMCGEKDDWIRSDEGLSRLAVEELSRLGLIDPGEVIDSVVIRVPKAYPAYFGTYDRLQQLRDFLDPIANLYLIGRNGMHRYNNQDHSMLSAMAAIEAIAEGKSGKETIWAVNSDPVLHEGKK